MGLPAQRLTRPVPLTKGRVLSELLSPAAVRTAMPSTRLALSEQGHPGHQLTGASLSSSLPRPHCLPLCASVCASLSLENGIILVTHLQARREEVVMLMVSFTQWLESG